MDALVEEIRHAHTAAAMGRVLLEVTRRHIGHSGLSLLRLTGTVITRADVFATCGRYSPPRAAELALEMMPVADRELQASRTLSTNTSFDVAQRFDPALVRRSEIFNAYWRPLQIERQLVGRFGSAPVPDGFFCVARSARDPAFTPADLQAFERIRAAVDEGFAGMQHLGRGNLEEALRILAQATPAPWFLFDAAGRLLWLTEEACSRLALDSWRFASSIALRHSVALERLQAWVCAEARRSSIHRGRSAPTDLRIGGERAVMRRFERSPGRPLFLVGFAEPASRDRAPVGDAAARDTSLRAARLAREHALTPRQTEVLGHLAHGKANKTIASLLRCAENTVELHVTALLAKLACENRAQLVARFWTS